MIVFSGELLSKISAQLSADQSEVCGDVLSVGECFSALKGMAHRKAPGNDGLPMEFYVKFWPVLGSDLVRVLNSCLVNRRLCKSQRRGVISLSFKGIGQILRTGDPYRCAMWITRLKPGPLRAGC